MKCSQLIAFFKIIFLRHTYPIREVAEEQEFAGALPVFAEPKDNTSTVVRAMYEVDP